MSDELIARISKRASNPDTIHDMAEGLSPTPTINPKATPEQLANTEKTLGYPLPPLLKRIYSEVGNGGFGPGYGLYECENLADEAEDEGFEWKKGMVPLLTWGCGILSCVDLTDDSFPIYVFDAESHCLDGDLEYSITDADGNLVEEGEIKGDKTETADIQAQFNPEKPTIEAFFSDWADGKDLWEEMMG